MSDKPLKKKIISRIKRSKDTVFTPGDFFDLSDRDQVGRALRQLVIAGFIIKFGQGLYAKAKRSSVSGKTIPVKPLTALAKEALTNKLKVEVIDSEALKQYNAGKTTQVPSGRLITVRGRVSRKMSFGGKSIQYQHVS